MARLGDICDKITDYVASGSFAALKENVLITNEENYAIMVKTADFANGFSKGLTYTDKKGYDFLRNSNLFGGELILSNIGSIGKVFRVPYLNRPMTLASNTVMVKTATSELSDYLYYYFLSDAGYRNLMSISSGTSMLKFNKTELKNINIPLPSIVERKDIVDQLSRIYNLISLRKQQIAKLDELVKARFVEMFGDTQHNPKQWPTLPLYAVLEDGSSVSYGIVQTGDHVPGGVPVFRPVDIADGRIPSRQNLKCTTAEISSQYSRTLLRGYELLITVRGSVGETFQVSNEFVGCNVGRNIVPLRFDTNKVLYAFMQCFFADSGTKNVLAAMTKGIALQGLNMSEFREIQVILPPLEHQHQFAAFIAQTDQQKLTIQHSLAQLELLKKALMQKHFM